MKPEQNLFAAKIHDLECEYAKLQGRIKVLMESDEREIRQEIEKMQNDLRSDSFVLRERVEHAKLPAVAELADAQLSYYQDVRKILEAEQSEDAGEERSRIPESEMRILYAEYSIDFAICSMKSAALAALLAVQAQKEQEKKEEYHE